GRRNVVLLGADMRWLALGRRFDLVVAVDDPFVHLTAATDRDRAMRAAARHLAPGGRLILDAAWFPPRRLQRAPSAGGLAVQRPIGCAAGTAEERLTVRERWRCAPDSRLCTARYSYVRGGVTLADSSFRARLWSVAELLRRLRAARLVPLALW